MNVRFNVGSNPVRGFEIRDFWRVRPAGWFCSSILVDEPGCSKFGFSGFGPVFGPFLADQVQSLGFLEGFEVQFWCTNLGSISSEFIV